MKEHGYMNDGKITVPDRSEATYEPIDTSKLDDFFENYHENMKKLLSGEK